MTNSPTARAAPSAATDIRFMSHALALARRGLGCVWPNPTVGCVLVDRDGTVVGRGWTQPGGRPHAETEALGRAGARAAGATCYVSLEPCAHHGETPPCAEALIAAGVSRVVVALDDPDPRVAGAGMAALRAAGIAVDHGPCAEAARALNAGFFSRTTRGRPWLTLKIASTLDGRVATRRGESQWITGEAARARGHLLRAEHDAILIGAGTAAADNPSLTCRLPGFSARSPVRVVLAGGTIALAPDAALATTATRRPTWLLCAPAALDQPAWAGAGVEIITVAGAEGRPDLGAALEALAARGITRVLVEGGAQIATALLRAGLVDEIAWFRAPAAIGAEGTPAIAGLAIDALADCPRFVRRRIDVLGPDHVEWLAHAIP